ncbi:MAG: hypothetical protein JWM43_2956 [Acidobacteriaceae bacterium]|nr:hypothetical protein [Acidobacteriaceae bacterium]
MTSEEILCSTALGSWNLVVGRFSKSLAALSEEQFQQQVAPGRNRLLYLVGHLTAIHDRMFPLLGLGERLHPGLDQVYVANPDRTLPDPLSGSDLRAAWTEVNDKLTVAFAKWTPDEWLQKHTSVSDEDFAKEPLRNRLSIVLSRTGHVAFHSGQAIFAKEK